MTVADNGRCTDYVGGAWQDREHKGEHDLMQAQLLLVDPQFMHARDDKARGFEEKGLSKAFITR